MKVKLIIISIILLLVMVFACGCIPVMEKLGLVNPVNEEQPSTEKGGPPDGLVKVLIGFKEKPGPAQQAIVKGVGGKIKYTYNIIPAIAASVPEVAIEALKKNPNITNVEFDNQVFALEQTLPWGIDRIDAEVVHDFGNKGAGVKVAIIDTGIDKNHEDLTVAGGKSFVDYTDDFSDDDGHGTHVAGIVAALDNEVGVVGVAPEAELYALKVLDATGIGYVSDVILAIQWASDPDGNGSADDRLDIINMSFGGGANYWLEGACLLAHRDGILLVAAAGNSGNPPGRGDNVDYPAAYDSVIAVAATNQSDKRARWSSTGSAVELAAPGVSIYSTYIGGYATLSGTSMASPHVAGTAALVWAKNPTWSNDAVRTQLQNTADDLGATGWDSKYGYGLVDAVEAAGVEPGVGTIAGKVTDAKEGSAIAGATVVVEDTSLSATTDGNGDYTIYDVAVGDYTVTASAIGYTDSSKENIIVEDNQKIVVNFALIPTTTPGNIMHVNDITMSTEETTTNGKNIFVNAIATVTIVEENEAPVEGAIVSGHWSGATTDTDSGLTNENGIAILKSDKVKKHKNKKITFTFTVENVSKDGWTYDSNANVETSDSITVP